VAVIPSTAMPATAAITLHANLFTLPPLPLLTGCSGVPTIPQVHYSHNDVAVFARFCYWLKGKRSFFDVHHQLREPDQWNVVNEHHLVQLQVSGF